MLFVAVILASITFWGQSAVAADCPGGIAAISDAELNGVVIPKTKMLYDQLGCELHIVPRPGRRGVIEFNTGKVDGELFRLRLIEKFYTAGFVRSQYPLLQVQQGIWIKNGSELKKGAFLGYVIGRRWQEEYAEDHQDRFRFVEYSSAAEMRQDYHSGQLAGFLAASPTIDELLKNGKLTERPELALKIHVVKIFHYLSGRYAPFMAEFDKLLAGCDPECATVQACKLADCPYN